MDAQKIQAVVDRMKYFAHKSNNGASSTMIRKWAREIEKLLKDKK